MRKPLILVCDDETEMLNYLEKMLSSRDYDVETFSTGKALCAYLEREGRADLLLQDVRMPDMDGLEILSRVKKLRQRLPVIIMTAFGSIDAAVEAIKLGAYDYVTKPFPREKLLGVLGNALEREQLYGENLRLKEELHCSDQSGQIIFASRTFRDVYEMTLQVAESDANILLLGESGTGKELLAATLHHNNVRKSRQFFSINCAALTDTLLESQIFGHIRGAFTGAMATQKGILEEADGGTLFLDEVGDMSLAVQAKLLRVIQEREFMPVGSTRSKSVDIRFVAATNKNLEQEVAAGRFREDLFYRLSVITIHVPPLRERAEDVEPLARHFVRIFSGRMKKSIAGITAEALQQLQGYHWPGNVRELKNVMERAVILAKTGQVTTEVLPTWSRAAASQSLPDAESCGTLENLEKNHILQTLAANGYHKSRTADVLGISRKTLARKLSEYGLPAGRD